MRSDQVVSTDAAGRSSRRNAQTTTPVTAAATAATVTPTPRPAGPATRDSAAGTTSVRTHVVPLLSYAIDEPSAFEVLVGEGGTEPNEAHYGRS